MNEAAETCQACGERMDIGGAFCTDCERRYPSALLIATIDDGRYSMGLRTGIEIEFRSASVTAGGEFVHVAVIKSYGATEDNDHWTRLPASVLEFDVRTTDIVWCCEKGGR